MVRRIILAAALALAACNQGSGPQLPKAPDGAQAPAEVNPNAPTQQANVTPEVRAQLIQQIGDLLSQTQNQLASGMSRATGLVDEIAPIQAGADHRWRIELTGGTVYRIIGACDGDCTNVDIELIDNRGAVVASDMLPDDYPVVDYTPAANGPYFVRILMQSCSVSPCYAGARVLTGGGGK